MSAVGWASRWTRRISLPALAAPRSEAFGSVLPAFVASRAMVLLVAIAARLYLPPPTAIPGAFVPSTPAVGPLHPVTSAPAGGLWDLLFGSLSHWDAGYYLQIANTGYGDPTGAHAGAQTAFFPLYPFVVRVLGYPFGGTLAAHLVLAYVVALGGFLAALYVLHRLVELDFGAGVARWSVLLLAFFPGSLYFSAPYAESLLLLTTVGAFYAARTGRWWLAGVLGAAAAATRVVGIAIVVPLAVMYLWGPRADRDPVPARGWRSRHPVRPDALWLAAVPLGVVAYTLYLAARYGDGLAWSHVQKSFWHRHFVWPPVAIGHAWDQAWSSFQAFTRELHGSSPTGTAFSWDYQQRVVLIGQFALLCGVAVAVVGAMRRLPLAYGLYALATVLLLLSNEGTQRTLVGLHRWSAVIFPLFVWLAVWAERRRLAAPLVGASAILLGFATAAFATGNWLV